NFSASTSGNLLQTVNQAATSISAPTSSVNASVFGQTVTFTVTVTNSSGTLVSPAGTVSFLDGATTIGSTVIGSITAGTNTPTFTFSIATLAVGTHSITAQFLNNANFSGSGFSSAITQTVNKAATTSTIVSSLNPSVVGQSVTFTATITVNAPGSQAAGNP